MRVRLKRVGISPEALIKFMTTGMAWRTIKGIPKGAKLKGFTTDPQTQILYLFVEHSSFEEQDPYQLAPLLSTEFEQIL